ncbi:MAG TPA: 2,3-bisphosphoglycerate-independent phosphoglycerate mutase [Phycisphaerales bacterium]|nr:2,3-bisphosphoglycerate-independent phosphoglycerate mutase [Phycisphaerales bacterium]
MVLIIRDGWGENPNPDHDPFNAIKIARTPVSDRLSSEFPVTLLRTSGEDVGLPEGTMGNSEVGHQNIGAGRVVDQESVAITKACRSGRLGENHVMASAIARSRDAGKMVHVMGIASDAGVHGQLVHLFAILDLCRELGHTRVAVHLFTDGRDTGPFSGKGFVEQVSRRCAQVGHSSVATVIGRYWAMDRDNRWERVHKAYHALTARGGTIDAIKTFPDPASAIQDYYDRPLSPTQQGDEFITPRWIAASPQAGLSKRITDGDTVIFFNYRGDRPRELVQAMVLPEFLGSVAPSPDSGVRGFDRGEPLDVSMVTMTRYWDALDPYVSVAFPKPPRMKHILGEHLAALGMTQFRCAETEKYPHVTFFFNDYREEPFAGESREIVQSPKVATYDLCPEMSARQVRDAVLRRLADPSGERVIIVNFANGDMVGHTGSLEAAVKACEVVDECVGSITDAAIQKGGSVIVTADHGNAEQMFDPATGKPHTAHTTYDVPLILVGKAWKGRALRSGGRLADIAPTILDLLGEAKPAEMTGESLLIPR